jgi:hypothetical protein
MLLLFPGLIVSFFGLPAFEQPSAGPFGVAGLPRRLIPTANQSIGKTAESSAGRAGERQTGAQATGVKPLARINGRIANRIESRIVNRIDRTYDSSTNALSPFIIASDATAKAGRTVRRGF